MRKYVLIFGSISGIVLVLMMYTMMPFVDETTDFTATPWLGYVTMIVALSAIFVGVKSYRDKELAGTISFGQAFMVGFMIVLVASAFYVTGWMIYVSTTDSNFMDIYTQQNIEKIRNSGESEAEIEAQIAEMENFRELYKNPLIKIVYTFLEIFPVGLFIALISAALLQRKNEALLE